MYFVFIVLNICYLNFALTLMLFLGWREWNVTNQKQIRDEMARAWDKGGGYTSASRDCNSLKLQVMSRRVPFFSKTEYWLGPTG
jgi:hypothetical protein